MQNFAIMLIVCEACILILVLIVDAFYDGLVLKFTKNYEKFHAISSYVSLTP